MGPKKDEKKEPAVEGYDVETMTREQVEVLAYRLQEEMKREREERAFFQLERDKVRTFWELSRKQLEECQFQVKNKEAGRAEGDTEHRRVLKFHDANIKFLSDEYKRELEQLAEERKILLNQAKEEYETVALKLRKKKMTMEEKKHDKLLNQQAVEDKMQEKYEALVKKVERDQKKEVVDMTTHFEAHLAELRSTLSLKHKVEIAEMEERHKLQFNTLIHNHANAMTELKNYYNEVTLNNLSLVASLKASCNEAREGRGRAMQEARGLRAENKKLVGPLREARERLADTQRRMTNYHKDKMALHRAHARTELTEKRIDEVRDEIDAMQEEVEEIRDDREDIKERLQEAGDELKLPEAKKASKRVKELQSLLEDRKGEAVGATGDVCKRVPAVQSLLERKNRRIARLSREVTRLQRVHETALARLDCAVRRRASMEEENERLRKIELSKMRIRRPSLTARK